METGNEIGDEMTTESTVSHTCRKSKEDRFLIDRKPVNFLFLVLPGLLFQICKHTQKKSTDSMLYWKREICICAIAF